MKMSMFQLLSLITFGVLTFIGVAFFAIRTGGGTSSGVGSVVIWGSLDANAMDSILSELSHTDKSLQEVSYVQKDPKTYYQEVVNALASGQGPDLVLLGQDQITSFADKIGEVPYGVVSQQTYSDSYIDEAQLFVTPTGLLAMPFSVDPMVLYWNRDSFAAAGLASPPQFWSDFLDIAPKLTQLDASSNVKKSAVALGGWSNVLYAKDILSILFMQVGDPIVVRNSQGNPTPTLGAAQSTDPSVGENPATSALQFFTEFGNPIKTTYSWNRSLPNSQDAFVAGDLAMYLGFASDYPLLKERNRNLHFGVAALPQIQGSAIKMTFGKLTGLAIPRTARNPTGALQVAVKLTSQASIKVVVQKLALPPVRTDVVIDTSSSAAQEVFVKAAIIARGWLDPEPSKSDSLYQDMIESVMSGKAQPSTAIFNANQVLQTLFKSNVIKTQ